jgi:hypothetical protein
MNATTAGLEAPPGVSIAFVRAIERSFRSFGALLLSQGVGARTILSATKRALIKGAEDCLTLQGRPVTPARVAVFTGLTQTELSKGTTVGPPIRAYEASVVSQAANLLTAWFTHPRYSSQFTGEPIPLPFTAPKSLPSFSSLVADCSPTLDASACLQELVEADSIVAAVSDADQETYYKPQQRTYLYPLQSEANAQYIGESIANLIGSLAYNTRTEVREDRYINRRAFSEHPLSTEVAAEFRSFLRDRVNTLLQDASDWLGKQPPDPKGEKIGLQIFQYSTPNKQGELEPAQPSH